MKLNRMSIRLLAFATALMIGCGPAATSEPTTAPAAQPTTASASVSQPAGDTPSSLAELSSYQGEDRQEILEAGAREEGQVVWYTELQGDVVAGIKDAFQTKYPYIQMSEYRISGDEMTQRLREEYSANRPSTDVIEAGTDIMLVLQALDIPTSYWSPELSEYPDNAKEPAEGDQVWWTVIRQSFIGFGYNTELLPEDAVPSSYEDLLDPALEGKTAWSGNGSTGGQVIGTMIQAMGEDFPEKLAATNYGIQQVSGRALLDLIVSGEVVSSPTIYRNHVLVAQEQGAPVEWVPLDPVTTSAGAATLGSQAPHPHAALLLMDFLLGEEGQAVLEQFNYGSPAGDYGFDVVYPSSGMTAEEYDAKITEWSEIMRNNAGQS